MKKFFYILCGLFMFVLLAGCAGPLDKATRTLLNDTYVGQLYVAKIYLGSRYNLVYTNNSIDGRSPTGVFIDRSLTPWYETDASFFEAGSSGQEYSLDHLQEIDRDLDFETFGQGIMPGQLVVVKEIADKSDQVVFEVDTINRYAVTKTYGFDTHAKTKPRSSRIHCVLGKEGMKALEQTVLHQMLDAVLAPAPTFAADDQQREYVRAHFADTPLDDLVQLTGLARRQVLETAYAQILSQSQFAPNLQVKLVESLAANYEGWSQQSGIQIQNVRVNGHTLALDCAFQEISQAALYHSPDLRAGLLFFKGITFLVKSLGKSLSSLSAEDFDPALTLTITISYLYFDEHGWRMPETLTCALTADDMRQFAEFTITDQELANHSEILMGAKSVKIYRDALEAVERIKYPGPLTWKSVQVEIADSKHENKRDEKIVMIQGEVRNTGTWIAEDVEVTAQGYDKYGFEFRAESTTLYGFLKPGETRSFNINMSYEGLRRYELFVKWKEVE
jgi:hypothetical protein